MHNTLIFSKFMELNEYHHDLFLEQPPNISSPSKFAVTSRLYPNPEPWASSSTLLSISIGLVCMCHINGIIEHVVCWLAYFTSHHGFEVHPCCSSYECFIPCYCHINSVTWKSHVLFVCSPVDEYLPYLNFFMTINNATMKICEQVFVWTYVFISLGSVPRSRS